MAPVLESLAQETAGQMNVVQIDAHGAVDVSSEYGVMSLPTMLLFKGGRPVGQWTGYFTKEVLKRKLDPLL